MKNVLQDKTLQCCMKFKYEIRKQVDMTFSHLLNICTNRILSNCQILTGNTLILAITNLSSKIFIRKQVIYLKLIYSVNSIQKFYAGSSNSKRYDMER